MVGPLGAALFAAISFGLGFALCGAVFILLALLLFVGLREPAGGRTAPLVPVAALAGQDTGNN
jgi:hypothetical protein